MRSPSTLDYVIGNRLARLALIASSLWELVGFVQHHDTGLGGLSLVSLALFRYARRARERVASYREWRQAWGQMNDPGTDAAPARRPKKARGRIAFALWVILGLWLQSHARMPGTTGHQAVGLAFGGLTLWGAIALLLRIARRIRGDRKPKPAAEFIARVVPSVPRSSPTFARITAGLPAYCKRLMARSAPTP